MATTTQIYRDGIANWIDNRTSAGRDRVWSVIRTFVQQNGVDRHQLRERKSERTSFPAVRLRLQWSFSPASFWMIIRGDQLLMWFSEGHLSKGCWPVKQRLTPLEFAHPEFFEHLADFLQRFDVELPEFRSETGASHIWR